jgi:tetratricopeptide (TPR) repeat protein
MKHLQPALKCAYCGKSVQAQVDNEAARVLICKKLPGVFCGDKCAERTFKKHKLDSRLHLANEIHLTDALRMLEDSSYRFLNPLPDAVKLFTDLFIGHPNVYDSGAVRLHIAGERKKAHDTLRKGLKECANSDRLLIELAVFQSMDGDHETALNTMQKVQGQTDARYSLILGNIYKGQGLWGTAAHCWEESLKLDPAEILVWNNLGYFYLNVDNNFIRAESHYRLAIKQFPQHKRFYAFLGDALVSQGRYRDALPLYRTALGMSDDGALSIDYVEFDQTLKEAERQCRDRIGKAEGASLIVDVDTLIESEKVLGQLAKTDVDRLVEDANTLFGMERYKDALRMYDSAIELDPHCYDAWANRAQLLLALNRLEEALTSINKALLIWPSPLGKMTKENIEAKLGRK